MIRNEKKQKIIVAHPFQQHSFKTARAVKESGMLYKYATTVYDKKGSWTNKLIKFIKGSNKERALKRSCNELNYDEVIQFCEIGGLFLLLLQRVDKTKKIYTWLYLKQIRRFNKALYKYIIKNPVDGIIVYDVLSADLIERIKKAKIKIKIILDMSAPYYNFMEKAYLTDAEKNPTDTNEKMIAVLNSPLYSYRREYSKYEINNVDAFLVASKFTQKSLEAQNISDNIFRCEYGIDDFIDLSSNVKSPRLVTQNRKINVIFVGTINQQKGAYQIFRIMSKLKKDAFSFDFYGNVDMKDEIVKKQTENCRFHGHVPKSEMVNAYKNADILLFPSLSDGFGFVVPEALANGVIVITTSNVGAAQIIENGHNGYIYNAGDDNALIRILNSLANNVDEINKMKKNTFSSIQNLTWQNYNLQVKKALEVVLK